MEETFGSEHVSLHVRYTNRAAFTLYSQRLGYEIHDIEKGYYADKEDAYDMRKMFPLGLKKQEDAKAKKKEKDALKDKDKGTKKEPVALEDKDAETATDKTSEQEKEPAAKSEEAQPASKKKSGRKKK